MRLNELDRFNIPVKSIVWAAIDTAATCALATMDTFTAAATPVPYLIYGSATAHFAGGINPDNYNLNPIGKTIRRMGHVVTIAGQVAALAGAGLWAVPVVAAGHVMTLTANACADTKAFAN